MFVMMMLVRVCTANPVMDQWLAEPGERIERVAGGENLTLASDGRWAARIVLPADSNSIAQFAAQELQAFLTQSLGQSIPIVDLPQDQGVNLIISKNADALQLGLDVASLPRDGFYIHVHQNNVYLLGRDDQSVVMDQVIEKGLWAQCFERGTLFAVYDFLERFVGVRFYFPGDMGTIIPSHNDLIIKRIERRDRPDMTVRRTTLHSGQWYDPSVDDKQQQRQLNLYQYRMRFETQYLPSNHGLTRLGLLERFGETHPEYFALMSNGQRDHRSDIASLKHPGHLCYNSRIKDEIIADAMSFFKGENASIRGIIAGWHRGKPAHAWSQAAFGSGVFNLMLADGRRYCQCDLCRPNLSGSKEQASQYLWQYFIDIAQQVNTQFKQQHPQLPQPVFSTTAYADYRLPPDNPLPENYLIQVATYGPWRDSQSAAGKRDDQLIKTWVKKLGHRVWLWNYATKEAGGLELPDIPNPTPNAIGRYYAQQSPQIFGAFMQSETDRDIYAYLTRYVFYKAMWDTQTDVKQLLAEHHRLMFGKAAGVMAQIFDQYESIWIDQIANRVVDTPVGPVAAPPTANELWESIYNTAVMDQLGRRFDKAMQLTTSDSQATQRIAFMFEQYHKPLIEARKKHFDQLQKLAGLNTNLNPLAQTQAPTIDGKLDDAAWQDAARVSLQPLKHNRDVVQTTVMTRRSDSHWYIAYDCAEPSMQLVQATPRQPDAPKLWQDNCVELFINPSGDGIDYYQWMINSLGMMSDAHNQKVGSKTQVDLSWNSDAQIATGQTQTGWCVEIAIPIKAFKTLKPNATRVNFTRSRVLKSSEKSGVYYTWSPYINNYHDVEHFGSLLTNTLQEQSILIDGDFETRPRDRVIGNWYAPTKLPDGQSWDVDTEHVAAGKQSLKLTTTQDNPNLTLHQPLPQLKPDTRYLLSFKAKLQDVQLHEKNGGACINLWSDHNHFFPQPITNMTGTQDWKIYHFEFTTGPQTNIEKKNAFIRARLLNASGTAWFDDVYLIPLD
jgi:antitoxin (DNA-binding transcriptional repressor) of toxin-antitoxin stability system